MAKIIKKLEYKQKRKNCGIIPNKYPLKIDTPRGYQLNTIDNTQNTNDNYCYDKDSTYNVE